MSGDASAARAVILLDHGSREPEANAQLAEVAKLVAARLPGRRVACAHLTLAAPSLAEAATDCVRAGARAIVVVPVFLAAGRHVREDLPRLLAEVATAHPTVSFRLARALGADAALADLLVARASEAEAKRGDGSG
jgi:sirohydrochlorin cobaltochelatase